jgi:hypothetical protein
VHNSSLCTTPPEVARIEWAPSASKHGIDQLDVVHAIMSNYWHVAQFDEPRAPGGLQPDLYIGPRRNHQLGDDLIEVMLEHRRDPPKLFIFHAMWVRKKISDRYTKS